MAWNTDLTGKALQIAAEIETPIRVVAGPGTGKSFCLQRRVMRLLEEDVSPERILAVTFTRTASASLIKDIGALDVDGCEDIHSSTLHSYCFGLLNRQEVFEITKRNPRPLVTFLTQGILQFEAAPLLQDLGISNNFGTKRQRTKTIRAFEAAWARLQHEEAGWPSDPEDEQFETCLKEWLLFHRAMLIGELVPESLAYLRNNPTSDALGAYDHVLVDEYQDLNKSEQELIDLLAGDGHLSIIGDADQSIYSFRFAHPEGITTFDTTHPSTCDHTLDECRRCPKMVVAIADNLIRKNHPPGSPIRLRHRTANIEGDVHIVQWPTLEEEIQGVVGFVRDLVAKKDVEAKEILILCPRRVIAYKIRDQLVEADLEAFSFYHEEALENKPAREAFAFLTLLANRLYRVALRYLLGCKSGTWLAEQYARLQAYCKTNRIAPWNALLRACNKKLEIPRIANLLRRFKEIVKQIKSLEELLGADLVDALFPEDEEWALLLRDAASQIVEEETTAKDLHVELLSTVTQVEPPEEGDYIRIMSIHKSKGLTSKAVIICGCVDGLIPARNDDLSDDEQDALFEEQRRLFYVGITRCTEVLLLSSFGKIAASLSYRLGARTSGRGKTRSTIASPFLLELGPKAPRSVSGAKFKY